MIEALSKEISIQLIRIATGSLFTKEQIKRISDHSVGKYLAEIFPKDEDLESQRDKIQRAQDYIESASSIVVEMRNELTAQSQTLNALIQEIDEKRSVAKKYAELAATNQDAFAAMRSEMENSLRQELIRQSEEGRRLRRVASAILWITTLILGAALGAYFKEIIEMIGAWSIFT